MEIKIYELKVTVILDLDLELKDSYENLSRFINYSMNNNEFLKEIHNKNGRFKHYCFSSLYPIEEDKIYKSEVYYNFMIRSEKESIIDGFKDSLNNFNNDLFTVMDIEKTIYNKSDIKYIDTLTPVVVTKDNRSWNILKDEKEFFYNAISNNLVKKFNDIQGVNLHINRDDIIEKIDIKNKYAIIVNYKGIKMLGYKIRIYFKDNVMAQELANLSLCDGVGEKNSNCGQGFCKPYFRRQLC